MDNATMFWAAYQQKLSEAMEAKPGDYMPGLSAPIVAERMRQAVSKSGQIGSVNISSPAFKAACKSLGIKHTYKGIAEYIGCR